MSNTSNTNQTLYTTGGIIAGGIGFAYLNSKIKDVESSLNSKIETYESENQGSGKIGPQGPAGPAGKSGANAIEGVNNLDMQVWYDTDKQWKAVSKDNISMQFSSKVNNIIAIGHNTKSEQINDDTCVFIGNHFSEITDSINLTPHQNTNLTAIGSNAGNESMGINTVAVGAYAGKKNMNAHSVAVGYSAMVNDTAVTKSHTNIAIGAYAGANAHDISVANYLLPDDSDTFDSENDHSTVIGKCAGLMNLGNRSTVIGAYAGALNLGADNIAIGYQCAYNTLNDSGTENCISIGNKISCEKNNAIIIGNNTTVLNQGSISIGHNVENMGTNSVVIGNNSKSSKENIIVLGSNTGINSDENTGLAMTIDNNSITTSTIITNSTNSSQCFMRIKINDSYYFMPLYKSSILMEYKDNNNNIVYDTTNNKYYLTLVIDGNINALSLKFKQQSEPEYSNATINIVDGTVDDPLYVISFEKDIINSVMTIIVSFSVEPSHCTITSEPDVNGTVHFLEYFSK